jgi:DNA-binding LacI/PurR family transcriptional regulator
MHHEHRPERKTGAISLRDIGIEAGVSFQTVSKVLHGKGNVSDATRARVLAIATDLGYVPNSLARGLATQRTHSIGFLASGLAAFVFGPMLLGAEREARKHGYFMPFSFVDGSAVNARHALQQLIERRVDGVISATTVFATDAAYVNLLRMGVISVATHPVAGGGVPVIGEDGIRTGELAAEHLTGLGHRSVAIMPGEWDGTTINGRLEGNLAAIRKAGGVPDPNLVDVGDWTIKGGYEAMNRLIGRGIPFSGVIAHNDHMAMGAIRALHEAGLRVPEDVSVVGCDDVDFAQFTNPPLTTVRISFESTGIMAVRTLLQRIDGDAAVPDRVVLPCTIVVRESSGPAPAR